MAKIAVESSKKVAEHIKSETNPAMNTDRRIRAKRLNVSFTVQISHKGAPIHGYAEAKNMSFSGMLLLTNFPLNLRDEFTLEFTLPGHEIALQTPGRAVRVIQGATHDEPTTIAVMFYNIEPNVSKMISGFVLENISAF